jgi:hypothetical protein
MELVSCSCAVAVRCFALMPPRKMRGTTPRKRSEFARKAIGPKGTGVQLRTECLPGLLTA